MADQNVSIDRGEQMIAQAKDFWTRYQKPILVVCAVIILGGGGWLGYKNLVKAPKEKKAANAMFKAEEYYRMDSARQALNGDGANAGFLKVISQYSGTDAANLANFYAGVCYIKLNDNANAIKYLKKFKTSSKPTMQRVYSLLADAYGDTGKFQDAYEYYKKSAEAFTDDNNAVAFSLYSAAYTAYKKLNKPKDAIELLKELKEKYSSPETYIVTNKADALLAELGVYNTEN
jgi:tetratricopeptide (TPR) repeat protein